MSFLDRFQGKNATVTAQGHLKKADGSEEIRVGPPKRRPPQQQQKSSQQRPVENNNSPYDGQTMLRQPAKIQVRTTDLGRAAVSPSPPAQTQRSPVRNPPQESAVVSPRGKANKCQSKSTRGVADYESYEPTGVPGRVRDDYTDAQPSRQALSISLPDRNRQSSLAQNSPKECRSPREINESRVVTEQDQLAFSRKARTVQYEPCKLAQYKKEKPDGYYELGKLQPDLNTDELVEKRAKNDRIKAFSQNLRTINKNTQSKKPVDATKEQLANAKPRSSREKGLAFAKRVPKPRLSQRSDSAEGELPTVKARAQRSQMSKPKNPNVVLDDDSEDDELSAELRLLQQRHEASRAEVEALVGSV
ncbi:JHY domain-containing protein [Phytophthora infestans]|uniref:JHY domain-containing protein n=1 Tax=Phytophthora infestans TaxID=4787 RepID=A0A833TAC6_PHYIN|nr:JHY domain-containing protein [Phytophthora infestans]KAF4127566.1 JHY domain-containing protein [Phytophthora infestans]